MAHPSPETSSPPAPASASEDALGSQVDALLNDLDSTVARLRGEAPEQADSHAPAKRPHATNPPAQDQANEAGPTTATRDDPDGKTDAAELDEAVEQAIASTEAAADAAPPTAPTETTERSASEIDALDELLADTATDHLDEADQPATPTAPAPAPSAPASQSDKPDETPSPEAEAGADVAPAPAPESAAPPAPKPVEAAQPTEPPTQPQVVVIGGPDDAPAPVRAKFSLGGIVFGALQVANAPMALVPPTVRDMIGWLSLVTLFNAAGLWVYLLLRG